MFQHISNLIYDDYEYEDIKKQLEKFKTPQEIKIYCKNIDKKSNVSKVSKTNISKQQGQR